MQTPSPEEKKWNLTMCRGKNGKYDPNAGSHFKQRDGLCTQCGRDYHTCVAGRIDAPDWKQEEREKNISYIELLLTTWFCRTYKNADEWSANYNNDTRQAKKDIVAEIRTVMESRERAAYEKGVYVGQTNLLLAAKDEIRNEARSSRDAEWREAIEDEIADCLRKHDLKGNTREVKFMYAARIAVLNDLLSKMSPEGEAK